MQRCLLFLFLVVLIPAGVFWSSHDFESPRAGARRWSVELRALLGRRPERAPQAAARKPAAKNRKPPAEAEAKPAPEPEPESEPLEPADPGARARKLFFAGRFAEAAAAFAGVDERQRSLAQLGTAFVRAFPASVPPGDYLRITTRSGDRFEGFGVVRAGRLVLALPGGRRSGFPVEQIAGQEKLAPKQALDRIEELVRREGGSASLQGTRLFGLIRMACAAGRPAAIAPLLPRALELDDADPYFLSAVRKLAPAEHRAGLYRAFMACELPRIQAEEAEEGVVRTVRAPRHLGGLPRAGGSRPHLGAPKLDPKVVELMQEAAPLRKKALRLFHKIALQGIDATDADTVDEALRNLDEAIALYEKALGFGAPDIIHGVLDPCSRYRAQLSFWQTVKQGR